LPIAVSIRCQNTSRVISYTSTPSTQSLCTLAGRTEHLPTLHANAQSSAMPPNPIINAIKHIFASALFFQSALTPDIPPFL
jgi:hypothetical protein